MARAGHDQDPLLYGKNAHILAKLLGYIYISVHKYS